MGLGDILRRVFLGKEAAGAAAKPTPPVRPRKDLGNLARRLGVDVAQATACPVQYSEFPIAKRGGGSRIIHAPTPELKALQRKVLRRLLGKLKAHPAAAGFERGLSIVANARCHTRQQVVVRMDIREFFATTAAKRIGAFFRGIGWDGQAADALVRLCTHQGRLPQGAPTSPRLSNLVNYALDERLCRLGAKFLGTYTRYADDLTFSFAKDDPSAIHNVIRATKAILREYGYELHTRRKLHVSRRHERQLVTGLVVNEKVQLPRRTRRLLRAVRHRLAQGRPASLTATQLEGWTALESMIRRQSHDGEDLPPGISPMQ